MISSLDVVAAGVIKRERERTGRVVGMGWAGMVYLERKAVQLLFVILDGLLEEVLDLLDALQVVAGLLEPLQERDDAVDQLVFGEVDQVLRLVPVTVLDERQILQTHATVDRTRSSGSAKEEDDNDHHVEQGERKRNRASRRDAYM
jgi:hypothetical protein